MFSTFLGGNNDDEGHGVAVDGSGAIYLTGFTFSTTFPTANPQQGSLNGTATDAFVAKITPTVVTPPTAYDERYAYDTIGNLTSKAGATYTYGAQAGTCAGGATTRAHAVVNDGVRNLCYDANGNTLSDGTHTYIWDAENRPSSITTGSVETYGYNGDSERVSKTVGGTTTSYLEGLWEATSTGVVKTYYAFGGQIVAVRDSVGVSYLHGDHLGSISVATTSTGAVASRQQFDPWGKVRSGGVGQTSMNYTGQRLDDSGLLYYHARYYNPSLGRFISADSVVPGNASGGMEGVALRPLTVDFHEPGFVSTLNQENQHGPWFTLSNDERQQVGTPWGPANPQSLNRYSYVQNNPMGTTDPSGHVNKPGEPGSAGGAGGAAGGGGGGGGGGGFWAWLKALVTGGGTAACADGDCGNEASQASQATTSIIERIVKGADSTQIQKLADGFRTSIRGEEGAEHLAGLTRIYTSNIKFLTEQIGEYGSFKDIPLQLRNQFLHNYEALEALKLVLKDVTSGK